jgi:hypothetical protein
MVFEKFGRRERQGTRKGVVHGGRSKGLAESMPRNESLNIDQKKRTRRFGDGRLGGQSRGREVNWRTETEEGVRQK